MRKLNISTLRQRGIGLLELMLSLAIIAILLVMATRYYLVTSHNEQTNRAINQIGAIQGAIANWKGSNASYDGLNVTALYDIGAIAANDYYAGKGSNGGAINTPWSTYATVAPKSGNAGEQSTQYTIDYPGIPGWACINLLQKYKDNATCSTTDPDTAGDFTVTGP